MSKYKYYEYKSYYENWIEQDLEALKDNLVLEEGLERRRLYADIRSWEIHVIYILVLFFWDVKVSATGARDWYEYRG